MLGYFDDRDFDPEKWKAGYPNPAFSRMTERDAAWMAHGRPGQGPARVHLHDGTRVIGLERPERGGPPR